MRPIHGAYPPPHYIHFPRQDGGHPPSGYYYPGHPITMTPISTKKWVRVSRVPYRIQLASVQQALDPYGDYFITRRESLNNVSTGEVSVLMNIRSPIPSKLQIAGRPCIVWYQGQKQTCYFCNSPDHRANACPKRRTAPPPTAPTFASVTGAPDP